MRPLFREREKKENNTEENIKSFLCNVCKLLWHISRMYVYGATGLARP